MSKLLRVQVMVIIVVGFVLLAGCIPGAGPQRLKLESCQVKEGVEVSCQTFEFTGEASILPF